MRTTQKVIARGAPEAVSEGERDSSTRIRADSPPAPDVSIETLREFAAPRLPAEACDGNTVRLPSPATSREGSEDDMDVRTTSRMRAPKLDLPDDLDVRATVQMKRVQVVEEDGFADALKALPLLTVDLEDPRTTQALSVAELKALVHWTQDDEPIELERVSAGFALDLVEAEEEAIPEAPAEQPAAHASRRGLWWVVVLFAVAAAATGLIVLLF